MGGIEGALLGMVGDALRGQPGSRDPHPDLRQPLGHGSWRQIMNGVGPVLPGEVRDVLAPFWDGGPGGTAATPRARIPSSSARRHWSGSRHPPRGPERDPAGRTAGTKLRI